jgi:hypothetical protein
MCGCRLIPGGVCRRQFNNEEELEVHRRTHSLWTCNKCHDERAGNICGMTFTNKALMDAHNREIDIKAQEEREQARPLTEQHPQPEQQQPVFQQPAAVISTRGRSVVRHNYAAMGSSR